ncbi:unnamed protein product [Cylindrotheca closterium]|uniref:Uncharacterized protein n=1 Tax=Cylindrotheca closterium TaxID=2856 RepID=A0AAD2PXW1_9STRA|nr:unnamed protein product [Cylindrotheca closterium]
MTHHNITTITIINMMEDLQDLLPFTTLQWEEGRRQLQQIPDYTSPPTELALEATPEAYRSDELMDQIRDLAAAGWQLHGGGSW